MLVGVVVLLIAAVAGWGMAADASFAPIRWLHTWIVRVILPRLRRGSAPACAGFIFLNNATTCALVTAAGGVRGGAWIAILIVGLSLGAAIRMLGDPHWGISASAADLPVEPQPDAATPPAPADRYVVIGLLLNLLEVPAIIITLGLAMSRCAVPSLLLPGEVWCVFAAWVIPLLAIAACGEALWISRRRPF